MQGKFVLMDEKKANLRKLKENRELEISSLRIVREMYAAMIKLTEESIKRKTLQNYSPNIE